MHRIDHPSALHGQFTQGDTGRPATVVTADWLNDLQENILRVIEASGTRPTKGRAEDLADAIGRTVADRAVGCVDTIGDLERMTGADGICVRVLGWHARGDYGGGVFLWAEDDASEADGGMVVAPGGRARGRWRRMPLPYVMPEFWGARADGSSDDAGPFQQALDWQMRHGVPILLAPREYLIAAPLVFRTAGMGKVNGPHVFGAGSLRTTLVSRVSGAPVLTIDSGAEIADFAFHTRLEDFAILPSRDSPPSDADGVLFRGAWHASVKRLIVRDLSGSAFVVRNSPTDGGDSDSTAHLLSEQVIVTRVGRYAWDLRADPGKAGITHFRFVECTVWGAARGGVAGNGLLHFRWYGGAVARCGTTAEDAGAFAFRRDGASNQLITIQEAEIGNGARPGLITIESAATILLERNRFVRRASETWGSYGVRVPDGPAGLVDLVSRHNRWNIDASEPPFVAYSLGTRLDRAEIDDRFTSFAKGNTRYAGEALTNATASVRIVDGSGAPAASPVRWNETTATGSWAPDPIEANFQLLTVESARPLKIQAPNRVPAPGALFHLAIFNASGEAIDVEFDPEAYAIDGYTDPAPGKRRTATFLFDPSLKRFLQQGAWSGDI